MPAAQQSRARSVPPAAWPAFAAVLLTGLHLAWFSLHADIVSVLNIVADDAAYYLKIALNAASGLGFTFDGLHSTDGFQPLWQWLLVPVAAAVGDDPARLIRVTLMLQVLLVCGASLVLLRSLARRLPAAALLPAAVVHSFFVIAQAVNGMESALLVSIASLLLAAALDGRVFRAADPGPQLLFGLGLGAAMLARLDAVFLGAAVCAVPAASACADPAGRSGHLLRLARIFGAAAVPVIAYMLLNLWRCGAVFPISAELKSSFPAISGGGLAFLTWREFVFGGAAAVWLTVAAVRRARGLPAVAADVAVSVLAGWVLLHLLHTVLFLDWAIFSWHFVHYGLFAAAALAVAGAGFAPLLSRGRAWRVLYWFGIAAMVLAAGARLARRADLPVPNWHTTAYEGALWARDNTPPEAVFAMTDAGLFSLFSGRRTINLDGIVNDRAFQEVLAGGSLGGYLRSNGVEYLAQHALFGRQDVLAGEYSGLEMRFRGRKHDRWSDPLVVSDADEVYRSRFYRSGDDRTLLLIWKLDG